jgi:hypothetical protein
VQRLEVQHGAAGDDRHAAARSRIAAIARRASRTKRAAEYALGRIDDVDQVMAHARALGADGFAVPTSMPR